MMDAAGAEATLRDLEAAPFTEQHVGGGDADIVKRDLHVAVGGVVIAVDGKRPLDGDARRVEGHQDHGLLLVLARVRRSEEHTSELQSLMRISYAVFCLTKKKTN